MKQSLKKSYSMLSIALPMLFLSCDGSTSPDDSVEGDYTAIVFFTTPTGGSARNELEAGSSLTMSLGSDGTTSGHLHVAAFGTNPAFDADMTGTWTRNGEEVEFTQAADTFVRNMVFRIERISFSPKALVGDQVFSGTRINLTLVRET